jgi:hypothetical protein
MSGDEWHDGRAVVLTDDREGDDDGQHPQSRLFAYCAASAVVGTAAAMGVSSAASGVARIALWATAIGLVSLLAGLAYDSRPVNALWAASRPRRQHDDARPAASVR